MLRETLLSNLWMSEELFLFVKENPEVAEWVKARVPPETWARLDHPSGMIDAVPEVEEGQTRPGSLGTSEPPET